MRYIVISLLLANFAYFGWNQYYQTPPTAVPVTENLPLLNTGLMLVSEFEAQQQELTAPIQAPVCSIIANFPSVDDAYGFIARFRDAEFGALLNLTGEALPSQFRVYIPPLSSRTLATTITLEGLSAAITDAGLQVETYLITRGSLTNGIALGVFAQRDSAEIVISQLETLGYSAEIQEIPLSTGDIQVLLRHPVPSAINEAQWLDLSSDRPYLTVTENLCETIAQGLQFP
jgi:hypothetical protein